MTVLDLYDDPSARVLSNHLAERGGRLPVKLASLKLADAQTLDALPDRLFALVGTVGGEPIRKFAMHDAEHLATSVLYFLETGGQLDEVTRGKVAQNLITGCGWYETPPPLDLLKVATFGTVLNTGLTLASVPGTLDEQKQKSRDSNDAFRAAQASGLKQASRAVTVHSEGEAGDVLEKFIRGEEKRSPADQYEDFGTDYANLFKEANLGPDAGSLNAGLSSDPRTSPPQKRFATAPKVSHFHAGEISLLEPTFATAEARHYALPHEQLYPIDTASQVKQASAYFDEYHRDFDSDSRRIYAQSVAGRAEDLGVSVSPALLKIAGNEYGPHIVGELHKRINMLEGTEKAASYQVLLDNLGATPPIVMYDMLKIADEDSGMDNGYGRPVTGVREPLSAVFGAPEKPIYSWVGRGHYITEEQLRSYSKMVPTELDKLFGDGWCAKYCDDPIREFDKLPDAKKIIVARLASGEAFRYI